MATFFFCGIGGIGMSAIALYLRQSGHIVKGSDRSFDLNKANAIQTALIQSGITLYPQDGSGVTEDIGTFVVTRAVENHIPDVQKALSLGLSIKKRPDVLADIFHSYKGIAIAGTCGKTSITAMASHILYKNRLSPTMINGGISLNTYNNMPCSNIMVGTGNYLVIEADESDGSIQKYTPFIGVVSNISLDHFEVEVARSLFQNFLDKTRRGIVINADCPETQKLNLSHPNILRFSASGNPADLTATDIINTPDGIRFKLNGEWTELPFIGTHNVANALAAIGVALHVGIPITDSLSALQSFKGVKRRLQKIGTEHNISIYDDYAHNPEKIKATLLSLKSDKNRLFAIYQPHGFTPTKLMKNNLIQTLTDTLDNHTTFIMPDIYYVGGTVDQDISSNDIIQPLKLSGKTAEYLPSRSDILTYLSLHIQPGDTVVVMGARDDSLSDFSQEIFRLIQERFS